MLSHDLRYGLRLIRKAPGFSAMAIASLAVGIGAATLIFSFANSLLVRPFRPPTRRSSSRSIRRQGGCTADRSSHRCRAGLVRLPIARPSTEG